MIQLLLTYRYVILFPLALVEGPIVAIIAGFFIKLGYFSLLPAYAIMIAGDFLPDSFYYYIGRYSRTKGWIDKLAKKFTSKGGAILDNMAIVEKLWTEHPKKMMFFAKLSYGLSTVLLISTGLVKMTYRKFLAYAFPITLIQYAIFISLGYYLGSSYAAAAQYVQYAGYILALAFIVIISIYIYIQKRVRAKLLALEKEEEKEEKIKFN